MKKLIENYGYIAYTIFIVIITILSLRYDFLIWNKSFEFVIIFCYYIFSLIGLYSFLKTENPKGVFAILCMFCGVLLSPKLVVLIPIALLVAISFLAKYKFSVRVILSCILILIVIRFSIGLVLNDFVKISEIQRVANSDDTLEYIINKHDQGALGVGFTLYLERDYLDLFSIQKRLMILDGGESVIWIDNDTLSIGNTVIDFTLKEKQ